MELTRELTIADLGGGAILERMEFELEEVLADCFDVNKVPDSPREIFCKIKFKPDQHRQAMEISVSTGNKLGLRHPIQGIAFLDAKSQKAVEPTAREKDMFDDQGQPNIAVIGGRMDR